VPYKAVEQEPSLVLFQNYENGNSLDLTNNANNGTDTLIDYGIDGANAKENGAVIALNSTTTLSTGAFTISTIVKVNAATYNCILGNGITTAQSIYFTAGDTDIIYVLGTTIDLTIDFPNGIEFLLDIVRDNSNNINIYINGQDVTNGSFTATNNLDVLESFIQKTGIPDRILNGSCKFVKVYNRARTLAEHQSDYNKIARQVVFNSDGTNGNADGKIYTAGMIMPNDWQVQSGSIKVSEDGTQKWLEQVTDGVTAVSSNSAYGTWEFDIYKKDDDMYLSIITDSVNIAPNFNGYLLLLYRDEQIRLYKCDGNYNILFQTTNSYISLNTKYRIKITRSISGVFTAYIKGGSFGDTYTLIDPTGGSGTNPVTDNTYTTSNYIVADLDAGDKIKDIVIKKGVEQ